MDKTMTGKFYEKYDKKWQLSDYIKRLQEIEKEYGGHLYMVYQDINGNFYKIEGTIGWIFYTDNLNNSEIEDLTDIDCTERENCVCAN